MFDPQSRDPEHFGWFAGFAGADFTSSSRTTRNLLGREPEEPCLLEDLARPDYYNV